MSRQRIERIRRVLQKREADAIIITSLPDIRWACGFTGSNGVLIVGRDSAHFVTDMRYVEQAAEEVRNASVHTPGYDLYGYIASAGLIGGVRIALFQAEYVTVANADVMRQNHPSITWRLEQNILSDLVARKDAKEVELIRRAQDVTERAFEEILGVLRPGISERDIAAELVYRQLKHGAEQMAFEPIVASGPRGAMPHARASDKLMTVGEMVVLDFGCVVEGYASDMTRTVALGEPGSDARNVYATVLDAQETAIAYARAGIKSAELDGRARTVIDAAGYGEYFGHSLGHGIGLRTHEWPPVSFRSEAVLPARAAVTIEPGIYLPDKFGVRIEDLVLLNKNGCENLTRSPKQLIVL